MQQTGRVRSDRRTSALRCGATGLALVALAACSGGASGSASGPTGAPSASAAPAPTSTPLPPAAAPDWEPCEDGFECATLAVPLDEDDPAAGSLPLALTRRPAGDPGARVGSLVVNPGGPGASAVDFLQAVWPGLPTPLADRFDLVAFDPRGVGRSGQVRCGTTAELDGWVALDPTPDDAAELDALERGSAELAAGCAERSGRVLPHVSTADAAADLDRVRAAVGDERLTYLGYSYGTALAAAYLDRFPTRVRAMALDGALDPALGWDGVLAGQARGFERAFEQFLADCERTRCAYRDAVTGDLGAAYDRLAARVDRTPLPGSGERTLGPGELVLGVGQALYSRTAWPSLGQALAAAEDGDGSELLALSDSYLDRTSEGYGGITEANLAVNCLDQPWPREREPYVALAQRLEADAPRFGEAIALSGLPCASWPVPPTGRPGAVTGAGAPPVVVIGTTGDPATPYAWSVSLAEQLERGVLITHRGEGHTVYFSGGPACVLDPVTDHLVTASVPAPTTC